MAFTATDFQDLLRLLNEHPEWQAELRHHLVADDLFVLPAIMRQLTERVDALAEAQRRTEERVSDLAEAQRRTEEQVNALAKAQQRTEERLSRLETEVDRLVRQVQALAEAQQRTEERLGALAEAQLRTEARLDALTERVDALTQAQQRTEERLGALAEAQLRTEARLDALTERVDALTQRVDALTERVDALTQRMDALVEEIRGLTAQVQNLVEVQRVQGNRMAAMYGDLLEFRYRDRAVSFFGRLLRRPQVVSLNDLWDTLEQQLTTEEMDDVLQVDLIVQGRPRVAPETQDILLVIEVSGVVDREDVERAQRRAALLQKVGFVTVAAVAGENFTRGANELLQDRPVVSFSNGRSYGWEAALAALE